jgi:hypothetical protein
VDDEPRGQVVPLGDLRVAGAATAQRAALVEQPRTGRVMDRTVHPAATEEGGIRGVDDRVDVQCGDVPFDDFDSVGDAGHAGILIRDPSRSPLSFV